MKTGQSCSRNQRSCQQKATARHVLRSIRVAATSSKYSNCPNYAGCGASFDGLLPLISAKNVPYQPTRKLKSAKAASYILGTDTSPFGGSNPSIPKDKIKIQQNPENQHHPKTPNAQGEAWAESAHITAQRRPSRDRSRHQSAATQSDQKQPAPVRPAGASR